MIADRIAYPKPWANAGVLFTINQGENLDTTQILGDLKAARDRITQAIAALEGNGTRKRGRPRLSTTESTKPKRRMSAAGRKNISETTKKRWAAWRKKNA